MNKHKTLFTTVLLLAHILFGCTSDIETGCPRSSSSRPVNEIKIRESIFLQRDLPPGYNFSAYENITGQDTCEPHAAMVLKQYLGNDLGEGTPEWAVIHGEGTGLVFVQIYDDEEDAKQRFSIVIQDIGRGALSHRNKVGEESILYIRNTRSEVPLNVESSYVIFRRCNIVVRVAIVYTDRSIVMDYARRLDERIEELCCLEIQTIPPTPQE